MEDVEMATGNAEGAKEQGAGSFALKRFWSVRSGERREGKKGLKGAEVLVRVSRYI